MGYLKIFSFIKNALFCSVQNIEVFPWTASNDKFYRLILQYKGYPFRIFINDIRVQKRSTYVCGEYDDLHSVKVKVRGILNSKTYFIETNSLSNSVGYLINLPKVEKSKLLKDKNIEYGISRKQGNLQSKTLRVQNSKKKLSQKLGSKMFNQNSDKVLKFKRNYSLKNTTNPLTTWKN